MISITIGDVSNEPEDSLLAVITMLQREVDSRQKVDPIRAPTAPISAAVPPPPASDLTRNFVQNGIDSGKIVASASYEPPPAAAVITSGLAPLSASDVADITGVPLALLDSAGLPWDARIHAETKAKIGDGTWRYRRNCDKELIAQVEAELRAIAAAPAAPLVTSVDMGAPGGDRAVVVTVEDGVVVETAPPVPPIPPAPPAPPVPPAPASSADDFTALMEHITPLMTAGKVTTAQMVVLVKELGLPHIGALAQRPDLIPEMRKKIDTLAGGAA